MNKEYFNTEQDYKKIAKDLVSLRVVSICGQTLDEFHNNKSLLDIADKVATHLSLGNDDSIKYILGRITHRYILNLLKEDI